MALEQISAKFQVKDENGNAVLDGEGKPVWEEGTVNYDLGDTLEAAIENFGADVVFSNYKSNARVALQGIMRAKMMKQGLKGEALQSFMSTYKLGVALERTAVNPVEAVKNAFTGWDAEKKAEFLRQLGVDPASLGM